ncbi:hypothetical protein MED134_12841 [Dokdonia sp. MED134]|uniref:tetratricopeptide repeat protein n=1 Tax=Dokdonia sp. MED134 TaxID=313590 RepID=UPI0000689D06|nr:hypothetical protein [Dokdonia sp. MED134]EAQ38057.3 hypothetical protein MED134_12841 [Dokdonia sp. MED134]
MKTRQLPYTKYLIVLCTLIFLTSCHSHKEDILTDQNDYNAYLSTSNSKVISELNDQVAFWNSRIKKDSSQIIDLSKSAGTYTALFNQNADIEMLKKAEQNLHKAAQKAAIGKDNYLRALAQNYITQHRFKEAKTIIDSAAQVGGEVSASNFVLFDVAMELGKYKEAKTLLDKEADFSNYNYLIRLAKWEDYSGNLDATIQHMENAMRIAERSNIPDLKIWVYTNLADYYGHAGRIRDSYNHYLKTLTLDPSNAYAKKGIAWITYSYENNPQEALRIIEAIEKDTKSPDYTLLKSEIYEYIGDHKTSEDLKKEFINSATAINYGDMYGAYLVELYASQPETADKAIALAKKEVSNRPTPMSYDLLARAHYGKGDYAQALIIAEEHVIGKTYEPVAQFHTAQIYKALGMQKDLTPLKKELLETSYELGPVTYSQIKNL